MSRRCSDLPKRCCLSLGSLQEFKHGISKARAVNEALIQPTLWNMCPFTYGAVLTYMGVLTRIKLCMCLSAWAADSKVIYFISSREGPNLLSIQTRILTNICRTNSQKVLVVLPPEPPLSMQDQSTGDISIMSTPYKDDNLF